MIRKYKKADDDSIVNTWYPATRLAHPFMSEDFLKAEEKNIREIYLPNTETWVYEDEGKVVGFVSMIKNEVGAIFLKPEFHGKGIGAKLMNHVAQLHKTLEVEVFEKNKIGRAFYEKYGFTFLSNGIHPPINEKFLRLKYSG